MSEHQAVDMDTGNGVYKCARRRYTPLSACESRFFSSNRNRFKVYIYILYKERKKEQELWLDIPAILAVVCPATTEETRVFWRKKEKKRTPLSHSLQPRCIWRSFSRIRFSVLARPSSVVFYIAFHGVSAWQAGRRHGPFHLCETAPDSIHFYDKHLSRLGPASFLTAAAGPFAHMGRHWHRYNGRCG